MGSYLPSPEQAEGEGQRIAKCGTILFDFPLPLTDVTDDIRMDQVENVVLSVLRPDFGELTKAAHKELINTDRIGAVRLYVEQKNGVTMTLRMYHKSMVTVSLEYDKEQKVHAPGYERVRELENQMMEQLDTEKRTKSLPELKRGLEHDIYFNLSNERLVEYDIQEMLFDEHSEFQHVQIGRTLNYGNVLILDDLVTLAESDLAYTQSFMWKGKIDYTGKSVLILGGGDGALLHEILKENPGYVTMIEIDDMVMKACRKYLRGACGATLDNYTGENYEVVVGDCVDIMTGYLSEGRKFDVIFGDPSDIPLAPSPEGEICDLCLGIIRLSFSILSPDGVYMTHASGAVSSESIENFETVVLENLGKPVSFTKTENYVPSFMEKWIFYQIKEKEETDSETSSS